MKMILVYIGAVLALSGLVVWVVSQAADNFIGVMASNKALRGGAYLAFAAGLLALAASAFFKPLS